MTERLTPQPWMTNRATAAVMDALEAAGGADCARFVGGCVRSAVIGAPVRDIDIATTLSPGDIIAALEAAGLKAVPTGLDHGTVTAVAGSASVEITTLRRDVETDGRHAVVAFIADWAEDAARRDFRINALYADREGRIFDPTGGGLADARAGAIVFVGDPATRIAEDALRIARYFRFFAWYGRAAPDAAALAACAAHRETLRGLSAERLGHELMRLFEAPDPRAAVGLMIGTRALPVILPDAADLRRLEGLVGLEADLGLAPDPLLRLASLLPGDAQAGRAAAERLRLPNAQRDRLAEALGRPMTAEPDAPALRRWLYAVGPQAASDQACLAWAAMDAPPLVTARLALLETARTWRKPVLPITGEDVMEAGIAAGPEVGACLRAVEAWWIETDFTAGRAAALERLQALAKP